MTINFQLNKFGGRKILVAIKEGRYIAKEGVYKIEPRQMKDETIEQTNKSSKKPQELAKLGIEEKSVLENSSQSKRSAPDTPPNSPPKMRQPGQEFGSPENLRPIFRSTLSPISSNHLLTPPNLTPPVTSRPYFKKIEKSGKKLNFRVEQ